MADRNKYRKAALSVPRALNAIGGVTEGPDMTSQDYDRARASTNNVVNPDDYMANAKTAPNAVAAILNLLMGVGQKEAEELGLMPRAGEQLGSFWGREYPGIAPGLKQPAGRDVRLPNESGRVDPRLKR